MTQVTIHIHAETAAPLLASGPEGARRIAAAVRQALAAIQENGRDIAYAPVFLGGGLSCAMSARPGRMATVVEIDAPGTLIPGRGAVRWRRPPGR